jgi:hypothetical protein
MSAILVVEFVFGSLLYNNGGTLYSTSVAYPPIANICPDYWQYDNDLCIIPTDNRNIGSFSKNVGNSLAKPTGDKMPPGYNTYYNGINFNDPGWSLVTSTAFCTKQNWANINNIWWDGITNVKGVC